MSKFLRIVAPHFVAGVEFGERGMVKRCPPIVKYMRGWPQSQVQSYCHKKGWKWEDGL